MMYTDTTGATKALHLFPNIILYILYNAEAVGGLSFGALTLLVGLCSL